MTPTSVVKDSKPAVTVLEALRDLSQQGSRINARMSELSMANTESLNRIAALKEQRAQAEVAAVRAGTDFDAGPFERETDELRAAIAGRDASALRRGLDQLRDERRQLIARRRSELISLVLERRDDADDALAAHHVTGLELERQIGQMRGMMSLALSDLDPLGDPVVRKVKALVRPHIAEPRRPVALDGMRSTPDVVAEFRLLVAAAEREIANRPPLEEEAA